MRADIDGVQYRISFNHRTEHATVGEGPKAKKIPIPFQVKAEFESGDLREHRPVLISRARAVTSCRIMTGKKPDMQIVRAALAVCSWSEPTFNKEFARQLALARVLEGLPREVGAPLLGAYMHSGRRALCDLSQASRGKYKTLPEALPKQAQDEE